MVVKRGLGKGLSALMGDIEETEKNEGVVVVKLSEVEPNREQPRKQFKEEKLAQLADSIRKHGIIQPLVVQKQERGYTIIAGERRWRAARMAGLREIPVVIKNFTSKEVLEISLIENLQREDLNPVEEALGYQRLIQEFSMTQEQVAERVGKNRSTITNSLRLLQLDADILQMLIDDEISSGHARALLMLEDKALQHELAQKVYQDNLSVRDLEKMVKVFKEEKKQEPVKKEKHPVYLDIEKRLSQTLQSKVEIIKGRKKGKIEIEYYNNEDLERIIQLIERIR